MAHVSHGGESALITMHVVDGNWTARQPEARTSKPYSLEPRLSVESSRSIYSTDNEHQREWALEDNVLRFALRLCLGFLQHLVAEYRCCDTDVQTVDPNLVGLTAMRNTDFVTRQID